MESDGQQQAPPSAVFRAPGTTSWKMGEDGSKIARC